MWNIKNNKHIFIWIRLQWSTALLWLMDEFKIFIKIMHMQQFRGFFYLTNKLEHYSNYDRIYTTLFIRQSFLVQWYWIFVKKIFFANSNVCYLYRTWMLVTMPLLMILDIIDVMSFAVWFFFLAHFSVFIHSHFFFFSFCLLFSVHVNVVHYICI